MSIRWPKSIFCGNHTPSAAELFVHGTMVALLPLGQFFLRIELLVVTRLHEVANVLVFVERRKPAQAGTFSCSALRNWNWTGSRTVPCGSGTCRGNTHCGCSRRDLGRLDAGDLWPASCSDSRRFGAAVGLLDTRSSGPPGGALELAQAQVRAARAGVGEVFTP